MGFVAFVATCLMAVLCIFGIGVLHDYFAGVPVSSESLGSGTGALVMGLVCTALGGVVVGRGTLYMCSLGSRVVSRTHVTFTARYEGSDMEIPQNIELTIPQRIMIANGLHFVVATGYHLAEDGSCILDAKEALTDYQACAILDEGIQMALVAQANLERCVEPLANSSF